MANGREDPGSLMFFLLGVMEDMEAGNGWGSTIFCSIFFRILTADPVSCSRRVTLPGAGQQVSVQRGGLVKWAKVGPGESAALYLFTLKHGHPPETSLTAGDLSAFGQCQCHLKSCSNVFDEEVPENPSPSDLGRTCSVPDTAWG